MLTSTIYAPIQRCNDDKTGVFLDNAMHVPHYAKYTSEVKQKMIILGIDKHPSA